MFARKLKKVTDVKALPSIIDAVVPVAVKPEVVKKVTEKRKSDESSDEEFSFDLSKDKKKQVPKAKQVKSKKEVRDSSPDIKVTHEVVTAAEAKKGRKVKSRNPIDDVIALDSDSNDKDALDDIESAFLAPPSPTLQEKLISDANPDEVFVNLSQSTTPSPATRGRRGRRRGRARGRGGRARGAIRWSTRSSSRKRKDVNLDQIGAQLANLNGSEDESFSDEEYDDELEYLETAGPADVLAVRINYCGTVYRFQMNKTGNFWAVRTQLMQTMKIPLNEAIGLSRNEKPISFDETPEKLDLAFGEVLDCFVIARDRPVEEKSSTVEDPNTYLIKFRANQIPVIELRVNKAASLEAAMKTFAEKSKLPYASLKFEFDGDRLEPSSTPLDCDLDDGCLIDVIVKK